MKTERGSFLTTMILLTGWMCGGTEMSAQASLAQWIDSLVLNHPQVRGMEEFIHAYKMQVPSALPLRIGPFYSQEEWNYQTPGIQTFGIQTGEINLWLWRARRQFFQTQYRFTALQKEILRLELKATILQFYLERRLEQERLLRWNLLDSVFRPVLEYSDSMLKFGALSPETYEWIRLQYFMIQTLRQRTHSRILSLERALQTLTGISSIPEFPEADQMLTYTDIPETLLLLLQVDTAWILNRSPFVQVLWWQKEMSDARFRQENARWKPVLTFTYGAQSIEGRKGFHRIEAGISFPLNLYAGWKQRRSLGYAFRASEFVYQGQVQEFLASFQQTHVEWSGIISLLRVYQQQMEASLDTLLELYWNWRETGTVNAYEFALLTQNLINAYDTYYSLRVEEIRLRLRLQMWTGSIQIPHP